MKIIFDFGGTLRKVRGKGALDRNYKSLCDLYNILIEIDSVDIFICTWLHKDDCWRDIEYIKNDINNAGLKQPKEIFICRDKEEKIDIYKKIKPDIVFDDLDKWLYQALDVNAMALKIF